MAARSAYVGSRRKLVLAFDLGTTYSGVSYSILDPGQVPVVKGVTKFPAQETIIGASKIPTVIYYDRKGNPQAIGAETQTDEIYSRAEEDGWVKAEWFKLHLRSKYGSGSAVTERIPPLPLNKTVVEVIADFLAYLRKCAALYIQETHANGVELWDSVEKDIDYVLSHPNGWEGSEQTQMRRAAVLAKLVPGTQEGHARVTFVTEGEASLHFAIQNASSSSLFKHPGGVVVVDAGGGTIDISTYRGKVDTEKPSFEEIAGSQCHFHGSVFVSLHAQNFIQKLLADSNFLDDLDHIVQRFDKTTKPRFRTDQDPQYIKFGTTRDNEPECGIRFGQLKLNGADVASFFKPSIDCIANAVVQIKKGCSEKDVVLVGGFAASDWLYQNLRNCLDAHELTVTRPDNHVNKAVSDGAISFYLDRLVSARISRMAYGIMGDLRYDPTNPDHFSRRWQVGLSASGEERLPGYFCVILPKGTQVSETKEFRNYLRCTETPLKHAKMLGISIHFYRGQQQNPTWVDTDPDNFGVACEILPNLTECPTRLLTNKAGQPYYETKCAIILSFGLTELKAQAAWDDPHTREEKRSPAQILYDSDLIVGA